MKSPSARYVKLILATMAVSAVMTSCTSNLATNAWMLLTDRHNFIPADSSIFFFDPYIVAVRLEAGRAESDTGRSVRPIGRGC